MLSDVLDWVILTWITSHQKSPVQLPAAVQPVLQPVPIVQPAVQQEPQAAQIIQAEPAQQVQPGDAQISSISARLPLERTVQPRSSTRTSSKCLSETNDKH